MTNTQKRRVRGLLWTAAAVFALMMFVHMSMWGRGFSAWMLGAVLLWTIANRIDVEDGPVAQRSEQGTHNPLVAGSSPAGPTTAAGAEYQRNNPNDPLDQPPVERDLF